MPLKYLAIYIFPLLCAQSKPSRGLSHLAPTKFRPRTDPVPTSYRHRTGLVSTPSPPCTDLATTPLRSRNDPAPASYRPRTGFYNPHMGLLGPLDHTCLGAALFCIRLLMRAFLFAGGPFFPIGHSPFHFFFPLPPSLVPVPAPIPKWGSGLGFDFTRVRL